LKKQHLLGVSLAIVLMGTIAGCLYDGEDGELMFRDGTGTEVRLDGHPQRIVTLTPALTEIIYLLGCGDRLVGVDSDSNYPSEADSLEKVSSWQGMDTERIVALSPDIVLMDHTLDASGKRYGQLLGLGIPVFRIYPRDMNGLMDTILDIGSVLGVKDLALEEVNSLRSRMVSVETAAQGDPDGKPRVLHVVYYDGASDPWVMTDSTFSGDMIERAGGECAINEGSGLSVQVSIEMIIGSDPDIIICSQSPLWPTQSRTLILTDDRLSSISAVEDGRVHDLDGELIDRTGPRLVDGMEEVRDLVEDYHGVE